MASLYGYASYAYTWTQCVYADGVNTLNPELKFVSQYLVKTYMCLPPMWHTVLGIMCNLTPSAP
jgi:hypothetical protein